jgi:hypothetical protein
MVYKRSKHATLKRRSGRRSAMAGGSIGSWLSKAFSFLKGNKILSTIGKALSPLAPSVLGPLTAGVSAMGLGRRHNRAKHYGGALRLAGMKHHYGGALVPAGGARARHVRLLM